MKFAHPLLLLLAPLLAVGVALLYRSTEARARRKLAKFSPLSRLPNILRSVDYPARKRKAVLFALALVLLVVAIARPLKGPRPDSVEQSGAEFFIVLDVSKSMLVRDVAPNRLEAVKASLGEWLKSRHGDRIGLILMAGDAFVQAPLTNDYTALREVLAHSTPASISLGGTNMPVAVKVADKALESGGVKHKTVVLISDGENLEGQVLEEIEQAHVRDKISFVTVGVGTLEGGKVPEKEAHPDFSKPPKAYVRDDYGVTAHSRLDERSLRAIATAGGGHYYPFTPDGDVWNALYTQSLAPIAQRTDTFNLQQYDDLFQIPLLLAIALLAWEMAISTRHKKPTRPRSIVTLPEPAAAPAATTMPMKKPRSSRARVPAATLLLLFAGVTAQATSPTRQLIEQSEALVKAGKAAEATVALRAAAQTSPDDFYLIYNLGIASYAAGQFQDAIDSFAEASRSPDKKIRAQALTQMGNAEFQLAKALLKSVNRNGASVALDRSVEAYESALAVRSSAMAENNLKIARERLESVLMDLADVYLSTAQKSSQLTTRINELEKAVGVLEHALQVNPKNTTAAQKLAQAREQLATQYRDQAREFRAKAEQLTDPKKDKEQEKLTRNANESYQQARANNPADKELAREHDDFRQKAAEALTDKAEEKSQQAMRPPENNKPTDFKKRQNALTDALSKVETALTFDETNQRAQALRGQVLKNLEQAHVDNADMAKAAGDKQAQTQPESAARNFSDAMQNYQKALGINPENTHAKEQLAKVEDSLAKALTESGKKEMAQATDPKAAANSPKKPAAPSQPAKAPTPNGQLRENIAHLEKAAQSFAQADALRPGENDAQALQEQAMNQLNELRAALDQAQNKVASENRDPAAGSEQTAANNSTPPPGEAQSPSQQASSMNPVKPVLSFSDIRSAAKGDGLFRDLRQKTKIRDW